MTEPEEPKKECAICDKVLASVGIIVGALFLYIAFDVLSKGKLTQLLGLGGKAVEE
jgi:hypothetical protein